MCSKGGLLEIKGHKPSISVAVFINLAIFTHRNITVVAEVVVMLVCVCVCVVACTCPSQKWRGSVD